MEDTMEERTNFSPFSPELSWGTSRATRPYLVAAIKELRECIEAGDATTGSGSGSSTGYDGVALLRAEIAHVENQMAYLLYATSEGDGGGGWFSYEESSSVADDSIDVLKPDDVDSGSPGRWVRRS